MDNNQQLLEWVKSQQSQGYTNEQITDGLMKSGYNQVQISALLNPTSMQASQPQPQYPVASQFPSVPAQTHKSNSKQGLLIAIVVLVVLAIGGSAGAYYYYQSIENDDEKKDNTVTSVETKEEFLQRLKTSVGNNGANALKELTYWEGVSDEVRETMEAFYEASGDQEIVEISFSSEKYEMSEEVIDGIRYVPNLQVEGLIEIKVESSDDAEFESSGSLTFPYGKKDGKYYIVSVIEEKVEGGSIEENDAAVENDSAARAKLSSLISRASSMVPVAVLCADNTRSGPPLQAPTSANGGGNICKNESIVSDQWGVLQEGYIYSVSNTETNPDEFSYSILDSTSQEEVIHCNVNGCKFTEKYDLSTSSSSDEGLESVYSDAGSVLSLAILCAESTRTGPALAVPQSNNGGGAICNLDDGDKWPILPDGYIYEVINGDTNPDDFSYSVLDAETQKVIVKCDTTGCKKM